MWTSLSQGTGTSTLSTFQFSPAQSVQQRKMINEQNMDILNKKINHPRSPIIGQVF